MRLAFLVVALVGCEKGREPPRPVPPPVVPHDAAPVAIDAGCDREAIMKSIAEHTAKKEAALPRLYGKKRATPGETLDDRTARDLGMEVYQRDDHMALRVGRFDPTYPGTCDPAGPCDCIGPGDERSLCSELYTQLVKVWGKPNEGPRNGMFSFESRYDDAIWKAGGKTAVLTADCSLVFY